MSASDILILPPELEQLDDNDEDNDVSSSNRSDASSPSDDDNLLKRGLNDLYVMNV